MIEKVQDVVKKDIRIIGEDEEVRWRWSGRTSGVARKSVAVSTDAPGVNEQERER